MDYKNIIAALRLANELSGIDLTVKQLMVLFFLDSVKGETSIANVRDTLGFAPSSVARTIQRLAEGSPAQDIKGCGLVVTRDDPMNLRQKLVGLSREGKDLVVAVMQKLYA